MTANNCTNKSTCGDFALFGSFTCDTCEYKPRVIIAEAEPLVLNQSDLSPLLVATREENAQLKRELETLRESEVKAWGLVAEFVDSHDHGDSFDEVQSLHNSRAALAARKAGA
jgi:hypothetical protein